MNEHKIDFSPGSLARKYIQNEFLNEKWNRFKIWFFDTYSNEDLNNISQEFYETCALHNHIMFFVPWFITTYLPLFINVLERSYKDESGNIIQSIYPPQAQFYETCALHNHIMFFVPWFITTYLPLFINVLNDPIKMNR
ncbi:hypothetical protein H5410_006847 [Solanum commersonii]|uniref:DUF7588 domain-containing protein n=1 Tax=Solanum commersonii TaxID=4109 RepID=A0A9J6AAG7_SOLCO|nr:hypothetical protein H5410_006847 [Solanum commersonii]